MNLRYVLERQQDILAELEAQVEAHETSDLFTENNQLKTQVKQLYENNENLAKSVTRLGERNKSLTAALYTQTELERSRFVDKSKERMQIFFSKAVEGDYDNLTALEGNIMARCTKLLDELRRSNIDMCHPLYDKIRVFQQESKEVIEEAQAKLSQPVLTEDETQAYHELQTKSLTREQVVALAKKYSMERFVGLNLISTIGIILIVIAAIFVGQFTVRQMTDAQRAIAIFILGGGMLVAGEIINRRKANVLSLIVAAGGIAVLYVALTFSYFALDVIGMIPALIICIAITGVAFVLSTRYKAQVLLVMAFVGGHLPFFAIVLDVEMVYALMVHFFILNLLVLLVSFRMKWTVPTFVGLGFNIIAVLSVTLLGANTVVSEFVLAGFIFMAFANYTAIPIISTYISKNRFALADIVIISINTVASCITMYIAFHLFGWVDFMGLLALVYSVFYFGLAILFWKKFSEADTMRDLAALTGLVFLVLIIPLQFDVIWLSLGWLIQGVALTIYGIIKSNYRVRCAGFVIFWLCILIFLFHDVSMYIWDYYSAHFGFRYLAVTAGSLLVLGAYFLKKTNFEGPTRVFRNIVLTNVWIYLLYLASHLSDRLDWAYPLSAAYLTVAVQAALTWGVAFGITRIKAVFDNTTRLIAILLYLAGIIGLFALNFSTRPSLAPIGIGNPGVTVSATIVIIAISSLGIFSLYDLQKHLVARGILRLEYLHVNLTIYALVIVTQNVIIHYGVEFTNIWLSVFYVLSALGWIIYGFAKGHMMLRRNGLGLALLAVAKVFILDLTGLSLEQRIASFFVMGILLVGIGFMYQYFSKKLEIRLELPEEHEF
ncbi:MAG: DUF2339 domain-containing protein [Defluviitaleaceae bacterium]|nr:DUF2339 domain-containing protein [Defluviitaleaceae bacterium]